MFSNCNSLLQWTRRLGLISALSVLVGCTTSLIPSAPDIQATIAAAVQATVGVEPTLTPSPDIQAIVAAQVRATVSALSTALAAPSATQTFGSPTPTPLSLVATPIALQGVLTGTISLTKEGGPYLLTHPVQVAQGATLTMGPGTHLDFAGNIMQIDGTLQVLGTSTQPVTMIGGALTGQSPLLSFTSKSQPWDDSKDTGNLISYASLNGGTGSLIDIKGTSVKITNSTLQATDRGIIGVAALGSVIVQDSTLNVGPGSAISVEQGNATIVGNNISCLLPCDHSFNGIFLERSGRMLVKGNVIHYPEQSRFYGNLGFGIYVEMFGTIADGEISADISENAITGFLSGIEWQKVGLAYGSVSIQNNLITKNDTGISFPHPYPNKMKWTVSNNAIYNNKTWNAAADMNQNGTFDLSGNWWGTTDTQTIDATILSSDTDFRYGKVNLQPILTEYPKDAPVISWQK